MSREQYASKPINHLQSPIRRKTEIRKKAENKQ